jgi:peroxiredoxin
MHQKIIVTICGMLLLGGLVEHAGPCRAAERPPLEGDVLPDISLPIPEKAEERQYLGLDGKGTFEIPKIRADVVIVEIFSMYCPFCQREAPNVNELYRIIDKNDDLNKRIKLIGIGPGNSPYEVNIFRRTYAVPFPLFADTDFALHEALGKVRTPYFIVIKIDQGGVHKVVYSKVGALGDPQSFLEFITKESGLKKGP